MTAVIREAFEHELAATRTDRAGLAVLECVLVLGPANDEDFDEFLERVGVEIRPVDSHQVAVAREAPSKVRTAMRWPS